MKRLFAVSLLLLTSCNLSSIGTKSLKRIKRFAVEKHYSSIDDTKTIDCTGKQTSVYVNTSTRQLNICVDNQTVATYDVSLGSGGVGKSKLGDRKTPLGKYWLAKPRKSRKKYHTFIHIGYPNVTQKAAGYTGGDVGIHGPPRKWKNAGKRNTKKNWGAGCVVLGSDKEIVEVRDLVVKHNIRSVVIL